MSDTASPTRAPTPPGSDGWPLIGHLGAIATSPLTFLEQLHREHGDLVRFAYAGTRAVSVRDPQVMERVFLETGKRYTKGLQSRVVDRIILGNGLVTSEGEFWRRQRKLAQPAFHSARIGAYAETMVRYTQDMLLSWQPGQTRDLAADMMLLTQRIVAQTLLGQDVAGEAHSLADALDVLLGHTSDFEMLIPGFIPTPTRSRLRAAVKRVDAFLNDVIEARLANPGEHADLLSMLLEARDEDGNGMTRAQLLDELRTIYLAGHETTSNTLTFAWLLLAQQPEVLSTLETELAAALQGRAPRLEDLRALRYADAVVKETMRLYPPIWAVARVASEDVELGGYAVKRGTQVVLSQWVVHRDPRWFPNPLEFRPQRWLEGDVPLERRIPKYAYFPFGGGPRICIGNSFAQMEAVLILATVAGRFRLRVASDHALKLELAATMRPKGGLPVRVEQRA